MTASNDLHDILSLFVATIFADKRVFASEIETFLSVAKKLRETEVVKADISEAKLLMWFENNSETIRAKLSTAEFESWFTGCLRRLDYIKDKRFIIDIMTDIAKSDDEFHISEKAFILLTARFWDIHARA